MLYTGDAHFNATIRRQAGDQLSLGLDAVALGTGDRVGLALTLDGDLASRQTLADQEVGHGAGTGFGQLQVVGFGADAVGVTDDHGAAIFGLNVNDLLIQGVQGGHTFRLQSGFAEGKQHVRAQGEVLVDHHRLRNGLGCRGGHGGHIGGAVRVHHQLQGGHAHVGFPGLLLVTQVPHVAVAGLQIEQVGELGGHAQTGQRGCTVVAAAVAVDVVEVGAAFCKHGEDVAERQTGQTGQGRALGLEVNAVYTAFAGIEVTQLGAEVLVEVVATKQGERGGVLVCVFAEVVQVVTISPTCAHTCVPVVGGLSGGGAHGCNGQSNQGGCHFHFHRFILVEFAVLGRTAHSSVIPAADDSHAATSMVNHGWSE